VLVGVLFIRFASSGNEILSMGPKRFAGSELVVK